MRISSLLIANRGEIAIRIAHAAAELGIRTVAVFSEDDEHALHLRKTDEARPLKGRGPAAYLDGEQLVAIARAAHCDAVHPGYGFLSERASFARRCQAGELIFVGPPPEVLTRLGDKGQARALAGEQGIPVIAGTSYATSLARAQTFLRSPEAGGAILLKALAGGGGRGMRVVERAEDLASAYAHCQAEAQAAFGHEGVYVERFIPRARHIEVQVLGDGQGAVTHLWERECTLQRRHQKLVEVAPAPGLAPQLRARLLAAATRLAHAVNYAGLGTVEFLLDLAGGEDAFFFIEANARLQVEHTVTEEVTGIDLVRAQLLLAQGHTLAEIGLDPQSLPEPTGYAVQVRLNMETLDEAGQVRPAGGRLTAFEPACGPGIRIDTAAYPGYLPAPGFDSLLVKLIAHVPGGSYPDALARAYRALCACQIAGVETTLPLLQNLLRHPDVRAHRIDTRFVETHLRDLLAPPGQEHRRLYVPQAPATGPQPGAPVLPDSPAGTQAISAPVPGTVVALTLRRGDRVQQGQQVALLEAMKMEFPVTAHCAGVVHTVLVTLGQTLQAGQPLLFVESAEEGEQQAAHSALPDLDALPANLQTVLARHAAGLDEARPEAVARRRRSGQRTIRENIADLCDPQSFLEYGALALAAQRRRRTPQELADLSPADGLVAGIGSVNGALFPAEAARCMVLGYDYTVFAGTQGFMNHKKTDRLLQVAQRWKLPLVLFAEGGGGRPGDTDHVGVAGLDVLTFRNFAQLSALAPLVGIVSGRCFAGNAALLGCCDVIIATQNATIGMGGPAMIEGGGLGVFTPEEVGPVSMQAPNGVIDLLVADEAEAVHTAKRYLGYFQGSLPDWSCADQRRLRHLLPQNRRRGYHVREVIETLADRATVLELRPQFGVGILTALIRIQGRPLGLLANNPLHLGGAIDADGADKAARFMQLCDAFDLPIVSLCDTPGFMVGPAAERTATVRHVSRMFVTAASLSVPFFSVVLRKGYGLGAQAMTGGSFHAPFFLVSWPGGEFGGMGLEGAVRLGYRKELAAIADAQERQARFESMVDAAYERGQALNMASFLEIDDVIDPMETRHWLVRGLHSLPAVSPRAGKRRPCVDSW
ncbi:MAG TPA: carboxyl transferase domain-containing protein [Ktedonobacteraceae bacterium]|jgi:acetyl/propionyl-CoA carboxylase alpha subunit/acetyl-CoA carboxylase carboxyltransferase component